MAKIFAKLGSRVRKLTGRMDQYQEAITFAEADQPEHARVSALGAGFKPEPFGVFPERGDFRLQFPDPAHRHPPGHHCQSDASRY